MLCELGQAGNGRVMMHVAAGTSFAYTTVEKVMLHHVDYNFLSAYASMAVAQICSIQ